ncbi:MFS transporter [Neobacillus cucumis]|uniref:MFS transporter n=1 Tax=Neobacillus cucumis TaxID=1740721 RepID=A0A2N5HIR9_9BACI|nr:MFS transporter [Neobacillus cucumis]PLS05398.1 MFS transporter [Neobacillus cucumis]
MEKQRGFFRYENFLVITMFLIVGLVFLDRLSLGFIFPKIAPELGLSNTQLGITVSVTGLFFGLSTLIFASLSDFIGKKKPMLVIFVFLFSIATLLSGIVGSFATLLLVRGIMGLAEGPVMPLVQSIVIHESSEKRRGLNMGIVQSSSSLIGGTLAPVLTVALAASFGWRSSFYIIAIPGILMGLIIWKFLKEPKPSMSPHVVPIKSKPTKADYIRVFKTRNVWLSTIVGICNMIYILSLTAFLPTIYAEATNYGEAQIRMLLGLMGLMMFIGQFGGAAISDRIGRLPAIKVFSLLAIFLPISIALSFHNFGVLLISILVFSLGNGYQPLIMNIIPAESVSRTFSATAISFVILTSEIIGGSFGPTVSGILADRFGLLAPLWVTAAAAFVGFLFTFGIRETAPIKLRHSSNNEVPAQV